MPAQIRVPDQGLVKLIVPHLNGNNEIGNPTSR